MSGGHWVGIGLLQEIASELSEEDNQAWRLLAHRIQLVAEAIEDIDRIKSLDDLPGNEYAEKSVAAAIGPIVPNAKAADALRREAQNLQVLADFLENPA